VGAKKNNLLKTIWQEFNFILVFIVIFIVYLMINGSATTWTSVTNIFLHSAIMGTIALGMGMVILTGDIDLSVGSTFVFVGGLTIIFYNKTGNILLTLICAIVIGVCCGFVNGILVGQFKMPAFIVTLSTMLIFRSISQYMMNEMGETRYRIEASMDSYKSLFLFGNSNILTISKLAWVFLILTIIMVYLTTSTKFGKNIYAVGSNEKAARLAGVNVIWTRVLMFIICGGLVGFAAFLKIAKDTSFDPATSGQSFELYAIAAVVIGGINMAGGKGKMVGIIFGTMAFTLIDKIITSLGMNALLNDSVKGAILLIAVGFQMLQLRKGKE